MRTEEIVDKYLKEELEVDDDTYTFDIGGFDKDVTPDDERIFKSINYDTGNVVVHVHLYQG